MLRRCLATTSVIVSSLSGVGGRTGRVTNWRSEEMRLRWAAASAEAGRNFRKIIDHEDLWMLMAALDEGCLPSDEAHHPLDTGRVAA